MYYADRGVMKLFQNARAHADGDAMTEFMFDGPAEAQHGIILAHGAGAPMDNPFMIAFAEGIAAAGIRVARFEFSYMCRRREDGRRRPPDRAPALIECWQTTVEQVVQMGLPRENLFIGGKSLGGRIASMIADDAGVAGLVCLGYPFHPSGKPERTRVDHLQFLRTPTLVVQGERDSLGTLEDVEDYALSPAIRLHWLTDGDHSFKPRKVSGRTEQQNWEEGIAAVVGFVNGR